MSMEKRGDISPESTPQPKQGGCCGGSCHSQPMTKEGADQLEQSTMNDAIDAAASQTEKNAGQKK